MDKHTLALGLMLVSGVAAAQTFTVTGSTGTGVSATGINISSSYSAPFGDPNVSVSGAGTFTLNGSTSVANPFSRFDVRLNVTRTIANYGLLFGAPSSTTTIPNPTTYAPVSTTLNGVGFTAGGQSSGTASTYYSFTNGQSMNLSASVSPYGVLTTAQIAASAAQAPLATQVSLGSSTATPGSPVWPDSTSTHFIFDFPSYPSGTASVNLGAVSGSFTRLHNSLGFASQHKDTVTLVREFWLGGVLLGSTTSGTNSTFLPNVAPATQTLNLAGGSVVINAADIYATTKSFEVRTKLLGKAYLGNGTTQLGSDYLIGQSSTFGTIQGVPEPATVASLGLGLLAFARRRKQK